MRYVDIDPEKDEFERYAHTEPSPVEDPKFFNPIDWWSHSISAFPSLHLYTFNTLAIPAMSAECKRVSRSTKKLITPERNRMSEDIIEASECLKN
jgi:hypothetical protein